MKELETYKSFISILTVYNEAFIKLTKDVDNKNLQQFIYLQLPKLKKLYNRLISGASLRLDKNNIEQVFQDLSDLNSVIDRSCETNGQIYDDYIKKLILFRLPSILDFDHSLVKTFLQIIRDINPKFKDKVSSEIMNLVVKLDNLKITQNEKIVKYYNIIGYVQEFVKNEDDIFFDILSSNLLMDVRIHTLESFAAHPNIKKSTVANSVIMKDDFYNKLNFHFSNIEQKLKTKQNDKKEVLGFLDILLGKLIITTRSLDMDNYTVGIIDNNEFVVAASKTVIRFEPTIKAEHYLKSYNVLSLYWKIFSEFVYNSLDDSDREVLSQLIFDLENSSDKNILFSKDYGIGYEDDGRRKFTETSEIEVQETIVKKCLPLLKIDVEKLYEETEDKGLSLDDIFLSSSLVAMCNSEAKNPKEQAAKFVLLFCLIKIQQKNCYFEYKNNTPVARITEILDDEWMKSESKPKSIPKKNVQQKLVPKKEDTTIPKVKQLDEYEEFAKALAAVQNPFPQRITELEQLIYSVYLQANPEYKVISISLEKMHVYLNEAITSGDKHAKLEMLIFAASERRICAYDINLGFLKIPRVHMDNLANSYHFLSSILLDLEKQLIVNGNTEFTLAALNRNSKILNSNNWVNNKKIEKHGPSAAALKYQELKSYQRQLQTIAEPENNIILLEPKFVEDVTAQVISDTDLNLAKNLPFEVSSSLDLLAKDRSGMVHNLGQLGNVINPYLCQNPAVQFIAANGANTQL